MPTSLRKSSVSRFGKNTAHDRANVCLREKIVACLLGALIVETPWFFGGINVTAQFANLALALAAFAALFVPLSDPRSPTPAQNLRALLKSFPFWCAVVFLLYLLIQYFNPHMEFMRGVLNGKKGWWLAPLEYARWLPSGLKTPYYPMNPLRFFVMWLTPLCAMCAFALGVKRSKSWRALAWASVVNAAILSIVGIVLNEIGVNKLLGFMGRARPSYAFFFASFVNANHAGVFLYLNLALAFGLLFAMRRRAAETGDVSGRHWVMIFPIGALIAGTLACGSRAATLISLGMLALSAVLAVLHSLAANREQILKTGALAALLLALAGGGTAALLTEALPFSVKRMQNLSARKSVENRLQIIQASYDTFSDRPIQGWGAGSFRYVNQPYAKRYDFPYDSLNPKSKGKAVFYLAHAHCDWLEFPSDLGIVGSLPLFLIGAYWIFQSLRRARALPPQAWWALLGLACVAVHALFDFPLSCPAIQLAIIFLLCASAFWAQRAAWKRSSR